MVATSVNIEIYATDDLLNLIRRAAEASQMTLESFMLEASVVAAHDTLVDQAGLALSAAQKAEFERTVNRPLAGNDAVRELLASRSPWER